MQETSFLIKSRCYYQSEEYPDDCPANFQKSKLKRNKQSIHADYEEDQKDVKETFDVATRIETSVREINNYLKLQQMKDEIKKQWGFVARVFERVLMILFLFFTLLFALLMLHARGKPIVLSGQLMASILTS